MSRIKNVQIYTWGAEALVAAGLPKHLKDAMSTTGWNAFGIYELVKESIRKDKIRSRKEKAHRAAPTNETGNARIDKGER